MKILSLYTGGGGIDLGFKKNKFKTVLAIENWDIACKTLINNKISSEVICGDVRNINFDSLKKKYKFDCIVGGPPCPPFSKSRFYLKNKKRALEDEDSHTIANYFLAVEKFKPKIFFFENVHGFVFKPHEAALHYFEKQSDKLGYNITHKIVNCADYGIPQIRQRFICVGFKKNLGKFVFPNETHSNQDKENNFFCLPWINCKEAIGDLDYPLKEDKDRLAGSKHKHLLKKIPPGDNYLFFTKERGCKKPLFKWRSRYWSFLLKLSPNKPSWTIQASFSNNMGPFHWKNRFLRINEIKRLQTFPDNHEFFGNFSDQWRQIGNAVPPLLADVFSKEIKRQLR